MEAAGSNVYIAFSEGAFVNEDLLLIHSTDWGDNFGSFDIIALDVNPFGVHVAVDDSFSPNLVYIAYTGDFGSAPSVLHASIDNAGSFTVYEICTGTPDICQINDLDALGGDVWVTHHTAGGLSNLFITHFEYNGVSFLADSDCGPSFPLNTWPCRAVFRDWRARDLAHQLRDDGAGEVPVIPGGENERASPRHPGNRRWVRFWLA